MGTLGCVNDMLRRDKENRELRKLGRERLKETRNKLIEIGSGTKLPDISVEKMEEIRKKTQEKEEADNMHLLKVKLLIATCTLFIILLTWLFYFIFWIGNK